MSSIVTTERYALIQLGRTIWMMGLFGIECYHNFTVHREFKDKIVKIAANDNYYMVLTENGDLFSISPITESMEAETDEERRQLLDGLAKLIRTGVTNFTINNQGLFTIDVEFLTSHQHIVAYIDNGIGYMTVDEGDDIRKISDDYLTSIILGEENMYYTDDRDLLYKNGELMSINEHIKYGVLEVVEVSSTVLIILDTKNGVWTYIDEVLTFLSESPNIIEIGSYGSSIIAIDSDYLAWSKVIDEESNWNQISEINVTRTR